MFLTATKLALVEALRSIWYDNQNVGQEAHDFGSDLTVNDEPLPRRVFIEYPEEAHSWPAVLVQVRPSVVEWTGITPDEILNLGTDDAQHYVRIRQGRFEASVMLQILSTTSLERDRLWDNLVKLILMGRKRAAPNNFYQTIENHDLIGITVMEGSVNAVGDSIVLGTPWDGELLTYESAIEFPIVGLFFADEYNEELVPLANATIHEYISYDGAVDPEPPYGESDGQGSWIDPWEGS